MEREERFPSIHRRIKIHLDRLKGGGAEEVEVGSGRWGRGGAAFGINAWPLIVRPITSI